MTESKKTVAKDTEIILRRILVIEANSSSIFFVHQPKAPRELRKFKK